MRGYNCVDTFLPTHSFSLHLPHNIHYTECNTSYVQLSIYSVLYFVLLRLIHISEKLYKFHDLIIVQYIRRTRSVMDQMLH